MWIMGGSLYLLFGSRGEGLDAEIMLATCCHRLAKAVLHDRAAVALLPWYSEPE
jgi:hypothetical protein